MQSYYTKIPVEIFAGMTGLIARIKTNCEDGGSYTFGFQEFNDYWNTDFRAIEHEGDHFLVSEMYRIAVNIMPVVEIDTTPQKRSA